MLASNFCSSFKKLFNIIKFNVYCSSVHQFVNPVAGPPPQATQQPPTQQLQQFQQIQGPQMGPGNSNSAHSTHHTSFQGKPPLL